MVAYLEKSDNNTEFHQIVDFFSSCSITYAFTLSPTIYAFYIEQFWNTASSKIVNSVKQIHAVVDGKAVVISESLPNEPPLPEVHTSRSGEGRLKENIKLTDTVPTPHDSPLTGGYTPGSDEGRITLAELMKTYTILSNRLKQKRSRPVIHSSDEKGPSVNTKDSSKQERIIEEMDKDENINLRSSTKDKGKGIMKETELPKKLKKKELIQLHLDEELAQKLYAKELAKDEASQEQERYNLEKALELQRQLDQRKENIPKGEQSNEIDWNDPQVLRYHALRNRPSPKTKVKKNLIMYLKNQGGYKQSYFKRMKYEDIRPLFERKWDQVHTFVPKDYEIEREVMKRARFDLQQGSSKKQKLDQQIEKTKEEAQAQGNTDQEVEELKLYMRIISKEDITIKAIPLAVKPQ
nr:hypothetical protein [Tanacetum cinerariifolium]